MENDNLSELELMKFFLKHCQSLIEEIQNHPEYDISRNNYHLLSKESKKALEINTFIARINGLISDLDKSRTFLRRFTDKEFYRINGIDQLDFIRYHFEVFIHKIHTISEVMKIWMNRFYEIELPDRDCTWKNLKNLDIIQKSPTSKILENYHKSFKHIIQYRHLNTHRAYYNDKKGDELQSILSIYNGFEKYDLEIGIDLIRIKPKTILESEIKNHRKEKRRYIKEGTDIAKYYTDKFIYAILCEYYSKLSSVD